MPGQPASCRSDPQAHFVLVPMLAQGHMIPMVDLARLLATRGATVSFITTPINAARIKPDIDRAHESGLPIQFIELPFPCAEAGLPQGCENLDILDDIDLSRNFLEATSLLREPLELYLRQYQHPRPTCMIADYCLPWTMEISRVLGIPRLIFHGPSCFYLLSSNNIHQHGITDRIKDLFEPFVLPLSGFPSQFMVTRAQAPTILGVPGWENLKAEAIKAEATSDGVVVNSFHELEPFFIANYQQAIKRRVWAVGPLSLYNNDIATKATRGNKSSIDEHRVMSWLDAIRPKPVIFANFGSFICVRPLQLIEVGLGLEASGYPFIWVIKEVERSAEVDQWLVGFEERNKDMGLVIKGWAPQVLILSHPAIRGFLTHCGWNSMLEAVSAGVPMITWPHFADQFLNEKLIVDILKIGAAVGVTVPFFFSAKGDQAMVKRDVVEKAVVSLMDGGEEGKERRERARKMGEVARKAMEEGGSSYENLGLLIHGVYQQVNKPL